jgi:MFS family permease
LLSSLFVRFCRLRALNSAAPITDRGLTVVFTARFTDEALAEAWTVLTPTFRAGLGLSLFQVGLLTQVLSWVALVIEPVSASLIDWTSRRRLIVWGSAMLTVSMTAMGLARSDGWLLVAFAVYGLGSGPLAHTADVVVVEAFPDAPERAFARATFLDTIGALVGPALVAVVIAAGLSFRTSLFALGGWAAVYTLGAARTPLPPPPRSRTPDRHLLADIVAGWRAALSQTRARRALLVLLAFDLYEAAFVLKYVWLHEAVGLSQPLVAVWAAAEQLIDLAALAVLDRRLTRWMPNRILRTAAAALVVLPGAWVAAPGVAGKVLVGVPLAFAQALIWPLAKSESLVADPTLAGTVSAVTTLFPILPFGLGEAALAQVIGTGRALSVVAAVGATAMVAAIGRTDRSEPEGAPSGGGRSGHTG